MTTMVRLLEREQLVRRARDPEDGRAFRIVLTAKARRFEPVAGARSPSSVRSPSSGSANGGSLLSSTD